MINFPPHIRFTSDDQEARYIEDVPDKKQRIAKYKFTKSVTNMGKEFKLIFEQVERLISYGKIVIL